MNHFSLKVNKFECHQRRSGIQVNVFLRWSLGGAYKGKTVKGQGLTLGELQMSVWSKRTQNHPDPHRNVYWSNMTETSPVQNHESQPSVPAEREGSYGPQCQKRLSDPRTTGWPASVEIKMSLKTHRRALCYGNS